MAIEVKANKSRSDWLEKVQMNRTIQALSISQTTVKFAIS